MANMAAQHWESAIRDEGITEAAMSSGVLRSQIRRALADFNRLLPKYVRASLTLVADQQDYSLPDDCLNVWRVYYLPGGGSWIGGDGYETINSFSGGENYFWLPSQALLWDSSYHEHLRNVMGQWEQLNESPLKILRLYSAPDSSTVNNTPTVPYIYSARRTLAQIPEDYEDMFVDAIMSKVFRVFAHSGVSDTTGAAMLERFQDSGLSLVMGDVSKKYITLSKMFRASFVSAAKAEQIESPSGRSDGLGT